MDLPDPSAVSDYLRLLTLIKEATKAYSRTEIKNWLDKAHARVRELLSKNRFDLLTPKKEIPIYQNQRKLSTQGLIKELKKLVGPHRSIEFIRLGLRIREISASRKLSNQEKYDQIEQIKSGVYNRGGKKAINELNLGSLGVIEGVLLSLKYKKKKEKLGRAELIIEFDKIIEEWQDNTLFFKTRDQTTYIFGRILRKLNSRVNFFFVFAHGNAVPKVRRVVEELEEGFSISERGYTLHAALFGKSSKQYIWFFELDKVKK